MYCEKPSPPDSRDWIAEAIYPNKRDLLLPKVLDIRKDMNLPLDQGDRGTCAAMTAAAIKEYQEWKDFGFSERMSPEFVYNFRIDQDEEGMYGRNVMKILAKIGICPEKDLPYSSSKEMLEKRNKEYFKAKIKQILPEAKKYIIKNYAKIMTIEGLKKALHKNGPCYISFPVYNNRPELWRPNPSEEAEGGHAMTVVGYNKKGFIIQNSWGAKWNGDGSVIYPYEDFGMHWEIWTLIDAKSPVKEREHQDLVACIRSCFWLGQRRN